VGDPDKKNVNGGKINFFLLSWRADAYGRAVRVLELELKFIV
jgi:hypothetical protein